MMVPGPQAPLGAHDARDAGFGRKEESNGAYLHSVDTCRAIVLNVEYRSLK